jgi:hypothetical protein
LNLCIPDGLKSCACCCGLYNVSDGGREALQRILEIRTDLFLGAGRSITQIDGYRDEVRKAAPAGPLDPEIYVCEFAGFIDPRRRVVGCMLHPSAPGNNGLDLRGLCHYGSMACKAFYCPAWSQIPERFLTIACELVDDWHLYGLLITDVDFMVSLFGLVELRVGAPVTMAGLKDPRTSDALKALLSLKSECPSGASSKVRVSRYHFHGTVDKDCADETYLMGRLLDSLSFTYGRRADDELSLVQDCLAIVEKTYIHQSSYK